MAIHTCQECGKGFKTSSILKMHMRTHSAERPYKCQVCQKSFKNKGHLVVHLRLHTGEKPYKCESCSYRSNYSSDLKRHKETHIGVPSRIYCPFCDGRWFRSRIVFNSHMMHDHPDSSSPLPELIINTQTHPGIGTVSCITRTLTTTTGVSTTVSRISSPAGSVIFTQTTTTATATATATVQPHPIETATVAQSSGASFSYAESPLNSGLQTEEPLLGLDEILTQASSEFSSWQFDNS